jgi:hypothetical protein
MSEMIPENVVQRLEREWRMIDRDRLPVPRRPEREDIELPRMKVGRVDA